MADINIVSGPPCGGKSTFVDEHRNSNDVVVDLDRIAVAFGSNSQNLSSGDIKKIAFLARDSAIKAITERQIFSDAWIIDSSPDNSKVEQYREIGCNFYLVDPGQDVCKERAKNRPLGTVDLIDSWYENPPQIPKYARLSSITKSFAKAARGFNQ
jgi:predicted ABC-type ATPase